MDLVLRACDDWFLDKLWAKVVPLSAFAASPELSTYLNATSTKIFPVLSSSKWSQVVALLPHPPITATDIASIYESSSPSEVLRSAWPRAYVPRQIISLSIITLIGIHILYFVFAYLSYRFIFNHEMMRHPRFIKNQVKLEIQCSLRAFPMMTMLTLPWFQAEVMGYTKLYDGVDTYGYLYLFASIPL